jgi:Protein of unknown function (DUF1360)
MQQRALDVPPLAGHSPDQERPLGGYAALVAIFAAAVGGFSAWVRHSGRELPERPSPGDLALMTVATHKASRLLAKDRVTSTVRAPFTELEDDAGAGEVSEKARGPRAPASHRRACDLPILSRALGRRGIRRRAGGRAAPHALGCRRARGGFRLGCPSDRLQERRGDALAPSPRPWRRCSAAESTSFRRGTGWNFAYLAFAATPAPPRETMKGTRPMTLKLL